MNIDRIDLNLLFYLGKMRLSPSHGQCSAKCQPGSTIENQLSFADSEYRQKHHQTRKEKFLARMETLVPWKQIEAVIEPYYPKPGNGRRPYPLITMLRIHCLQQWYSLSDPAM